MTCQPRSCPDCGDRLIHQSKRGPGESSSAFGQFVHDKIGRVMYWADIDGAALRNKTKVLRIIEHKPPNGNPSESQKAILPLLAKAIQLLASTGLVHEQSGVFVVRSEHPHDKAQIWQIEGWAGRGKGLRTVLSGDLFRHFIEGEILDPVSLTAVEAA